MHARIGIVVFWSLLLCLEPAQARRIAPSVEDDVARHGEARVLVILESGASAADAPSARRATVGRAQAGVLERLAGAQFHLAHRFSGVAGIAGTVTTAGLETLRQTPGVAAVLPDQEMVGGLGASVPHIHADRVQDVYGFDGTGVTVAVIDSGFDSDHPMLVGVLVGEQCYCSRNGGCCPDGSTAQSGAGSAEDDNGHGTGVSGVIAKNHTASPSRGVAPGAKIVAIKVLDHLALSGIESDTIAALDWIAANRPDVRVVNLSLGTVAHYPGYCDADNPLMAAAIDNLVAQGVTVFAISHNFSHADGISSPACIQNAVAVGGVDGNDVVPSFSNSGAALDLLGPAVNITTTYREGSLEALSGTSFASPHAAGTAALLLDAYPWLTPAELETSLERSGVPVTDARNGLVRPRVDAEAALLDVTCGNGMLDYDEGCDDGNRDSGDGCDANCTPTGCGNAIVTAGEECDAGGANGADDCCSATCALVDLDGDAVCDRDDRCPHVSSASVPVFLSGLKRVVFRYGSGGPGLGEDLLKVVRAEFRTEANIDLDSTDTLRLTITNLRSGGEIFSALLPPSAKWRQPSPTKKRWTYLDRDEPTASGLRRVTVGQVGTSLPTTYRLVASGRDASLSTADVPLVAATDDVLVRLEIENASGGLCYAGQLADCRNNSSRRDTCR